MLPYKILGSILSYLHVMAMFDIKTSYIHVKYLELGRTDKSVRSNFEPWSGFIIYHPPSPLPLSQNIQRERESLMENACISKQKCNLVSIKERWREECNGMDSFHSHKDVGSPFVFFWVRWLILGVTLAWQGSPWLVQSPMQDRVPRVSIWVPRMPQITSGSEGHRWGLSFPSFPFTRDHHPHWRQPNQVLPGCLSKWDLDLIPLGAQGIPVPVILREGSAISLPWVLVMEFVPCPNFNFASRTYIIFFISLKP